MRIQTPLTREDIKNHLTYSTWKYALVLVFAIFGWMLIYDMTAYRSPQDKRIDLYVQTATTTSEIMDAFIKPVWESAAPDMETVQSVALLSSDDAATQMQITTFAYTGEGDIYFVTEQYFKSLSGAGAFLPLEDLVENGEIDVEGVDLKKGYVTVVAESDAKGTPVSTVSHLFGIPLDSYDGFMKGMLLDNRGMYACILYANQNDEHVIPFFNALLQAGRGEQED